MYAGSKYESHYTVWTAWISIRVRVRVGVYFILKNLAPPGTTVHVPTANNLGLNIAAVGSWTREIKVPLLLVQNQLNKIIPHLNPNN